MAVGICVIGGGASGMMAAIIAARKGAEVTVIEHTDRVGKKILMTGNGKCNFTNDHMSQECFRGTHPEYAMQVIRQFSGQDTLRFFDSLGLLYKEKNGYYYPCSNQASSVLDVLRFALKKHKVNVITQAVPVQIQAGKNGGFTVMLKDASVSLPHGGRFDRIILACGGKAAPKTGSDGSGYTLAKGLGHHIIKPAPALVQLTSPEKYFKGLKGIRLDAELMLESNGKPIAGEKGELQLTDYGISGIPVFQISRYVSCADGRKEKSIVHIDCMSCMTTEELYDFLHRKFCENPLLTAEENMQGILHKNLNLFFLKQASIRPDKPLALSSNDRLALLCEQIKDWRVPIDGTKDFDSCQVCAGGVDTTQLDQHCQSKLHKGLYLIGELVDVDGICGGYNLQWAWSSGYVAGTHAAE